MYQVTVRHQLKYDRTIDMTLRGTALGSLRDMMDSLIIPGVQSRSIGRWNKPARSNLWQKDDGTTTPLLMTVLNESATFVGVRD